MSLAFNGYNIHVSRPDQFKAMVSVNASVVNLSGACPGFLKGGVQYLLVP